MLSTFCNSSMQPQANFNLVLLPPESDSLVTQVDICGAKWPRGHRRALTTMPQDADLKIPLQRDESCLDFWANGLQPLIPPPPVES